MQMQLHPDLHNFECVFSHCVGRIFQRVENYIENGSGSVVVFIKNLDVNVMKFKRNLF